MYDNDQVSDIENRSNETHKRTAYTTPKLTKLKHDESVSSVNSTLSLGDSYYDKHPAPHKSIQQVKPNR